MEIICPKCLIQLDAENVTPGTSVACPNCGHCFVAEDDYSVEPPQAKQIAQFTTAKTEDSKKQPLVPKSSDAEQFLRFLSYFILVCSLFCFVASFMGAAGQPATMIFAGIGCLVQSAIGHAFCNHLQYQREQIGLLKEIASKK